jgi:transposase
MPYRTFSREQDWLLPPSLGDLLASDHLVRFVAEFVDLLELEPVGIVAEPAVEGVPSYHPRVLLGVWLYGFMVRVRSSRKLEAACRENVAFMWLTGLQRPDHVTLWRFYKQNRKVMRQLLKRTVCLATEVGLVDFALQAVDGSRVAVSSLDSLKGRTALEKLLAQVEAEIVAMEQANQCEDGPDSRTRPGPHALLGKHEMRERLQRALAALAELEKAPTAAGQEPRAPCRHYQCGGKRGRNEPKPVPERGPSEPWARAGNCSASDQLSRLRRPAPGGCGGTNHHRT